MDDDLCVDYSVFEIDGPIIAIIRRDTLNDPIAPQLGGAIDTKAKGLLVPFFTDADLATRFVERIGDPNLAAWHVSLMAVILEALKNAGHTHVIFDPEPGQPMRCVSIEQMLSDLSKQAD